MESPQAIHRPLSALAGNRLPPHAFMARNELQGRRGMRVLTLAAPAVVAMLTAACGTSYRDNNDPVPRDAPVRSEEHPSELQFLMRNTYAVFCLQKTNQLPPLHSNIKHQAFSYMGLITHI